MKKTQREPNRLLEEGDEFSPPYISTLDFDPVKVFSNSLESSPELIFNMYLSEMKSSQHNVIELPRKGTKNSPP